MNYRKIEKVLTPKTFNWVGNGFYTSSFVGKEISRERMSPFFAVGYNAEIEFEASEIPRGVGAHPHKGFETVTIAYKGKVAHEDSMGNHGVINEGDVQWMTAGAGILHQEHHEKEWAKQGGAFQMVQMWVNLPAKDKETPAHYQNLVYKEMTTVPVSETGFIKVIAGEFRQQKGTATTYSPIHLYNSYLKKGDCVDFTFPVHFNTAILVIDGSVTVNESETFSKDSFVLFENDGEGVFRLEVKDENALVLVMSGEPLNEPVVHYGPFVMNTAAQIEQAILDFNSGKFGNL